jgi:hypothetical protein
MGESQKWHGVKQETTYLSGLAGLALTLATALCWVALLGYVAIKLL